MNSFELVMSAFAHTVEQYALQKGITFSCVTLLNIDPHKQAFGDISSNAALILSKQLNQPPQVIAQEIMNRFSHPSVSSCAMAGPGFINITVTEECMSQLLHGLRSQGDHFFAKKQNNPQYYSVEFVSANPTGPLHIGHGRNGIIGDTLARVARFIGHEVTREFYINDAGNQITLLGESVYARLQQLCGIDTPVPENGYQGTYITQIAQRLLDTQGAQVQEKPLSFFATYAKNELLKEQKSTLEAYHITFDVWFSEQSLHTNGEIETALQELEKAGHLYEQEGALWFRAAALGDEKDRVVKRSSGEYTYVAADIAYLKNKINRGFTTLVIVVGQDHHGYVARLKAALRAFGYNPDMLHVALYQIVTLKNEGILLKLSKRAGRIISLQDIIETVGKDVARFFFLHRKADAHLDFDLAVACKHTEENPVYYIQYAYVRTLSMLEKASREGITNLLDQDKGILTQSERLILKKIASLKSILATIVSEYQTHLLAYYVVELAQLFHAYYAHHRVINLADIPTTRSRLLLVEQIRNTLHLCLTLLGLNCPQSM